MQGPKIIQGGNFVDDRGRIKFANDFDMTDVKRFYTVSNHTRGFIRAWHYHKKEAKYVVCTRGSMKVAIVKPFEIDYVPPSGCREEIHIHYLSEGDGKVFYVPAGYANGFQSLTDDAELTFYSTSTVEESKGDDIRYDWDYWNIWNLQDYR